MNDLTELDESIRNQDRDLAALEAGGNEETITPSAPSSESDTMPFYEQIAAAAVRAKKSHADFVTKLRSGCPFQFAQLVPFRGAREKNPAHHFAEWKAMEKVSNEMFVLRIDFAAFYQQQYRSAMRQFKTASAAAAAVSRHQDELVDVNDGCKVDGAGGTSTSNRRLSWWDHIVSSYNVVQLPVLTGIRGQPP